MIHWQRRALLNPSLSMEMGNLISCRVRSIFGSVERSKSSCEMFDLATCLSRPSLHFEFLSSPVRPTFPIYVSYISTQKTNQILVFQESEPIVFSQLDLNLLRIACSAQWNLGQRHMASSFRVSASFLNGLKALFPENSNAIGSTLQPPSMYFFESR